MSRRRWEDELSIDELRAGVAAAWGAWTLRGPAPDLSDCLAARLPRARHLLVLWEPIRTHAPSPARCQPYCCYLRTAIFYHRPYITRPAPPWRDRSGRLRPATGREFVEYDQVETRLRHEDVVSFDGDEWEIGAGYVRWHRRRWWMRRWARRQTSSESRQLISEGEAA